MAQDLAATLAELGQELESSLSAAIDSLEQKAARFDVDLRSELVTLKAYERAIQQHGGVQEPAPSEPEPTPDATEKKDAAGEKTDGEPEKKDDDGKTDGGGDVDDDENKQPEDKQPDEKEPDDEKNGPGEETPTE